ncbi:MAG TPA: class I SAM-dependent methyltransferase [Candidatus Paceibacterota bacterium]|nr:class I SAM-dependent methyltransferase [Candidatus Paceibacterota bacterium]
MNHDLLSTLSIPQMDQFHEYPDPCVNNRYYHHRKAQIVSTFIQKYANPSHTLLDAGAGRGPYSAFAAPLYKSVYMFEFDASELEHAKKHTKNISNIHGEAVDLRQIPLGDAMVDVCICSEVLEHIPNHEKAVSELFRTLTPNGVALVSIPNAFSLFYIKVRFGKRHRELLTRLAQRDTNVFSTPEESGLSYLEWEMIRHISFPFWKTKALLKKAGFTIIASQGANIVPMPYRVRSFLLKKFPIGFKVWIGIDSALGKIFPFLGSFYFLTLKKLP